MPGAGLTPLLPKVPDRLSLSICFAEGRSAESTLLCGEGARGWGLPGIEAGLKIGVEVPNDRGEIGRGEVSGGRDEMGFGCSPFPEECESRVTVGESLGAGGGAALGICSGVRRAELKDCARGRFCGPMLRSSIPSPLCAIRRQAPLSVICKQFSSLAPHCYPMLGAEQAPGAWCMHPFAVSE